MRGANCPTSRTSPKSVMAHRISVPYRPGRRGPVPSKLPGSPPRNHQVGGEDQSMALPTAPPTAAAPPWTPPEPALPPATRPAGTGLGLPATPAGGVRLRPADLVFALVL